VLSKRFDALSRAGCQHLVNHSIDFVGFACWKLERPKPLLSHPYSVGRLVQGPACIYRCSSLLNACRVILWWIAAGLFCATFKPGGGSVEGVTSGAQLNEPGHYPGARRGPRDLEQAAGGPGLPSAGPSPRPGGGCCRAWCSARAAATAWPYTRADRSHPAGSCAVWTCPAGPGKLVVELAGRRVEDSLPGRQGRLLFGYVAINRPRRIGRDELMEMLWPEGTPARADAALRAVGSRLRSVIGPEILTGRGPLGLDLHVDAWIDLGVAEAAIHQAESAIQRSRWHNAWVPSHIALNISRRPLLAGLDAPWLDERRRHLDGIRLRAVETWSTAGLGIGGPDLSDAEAAASKPVALSPLRESAYVLLMQTLQARENSESSPARCGRKQCFVSLRPGPGGCERARGPNRSSSAAAETPVPHPRSARANSGAGRDTRSAAVPRRTDDFERRRRNARWLPRPSSCQPSQWEALVGVDSCQKSFPVTMQQKSSDRQLAHSDNPLRDNRSRPFHSL
jgi:SARP family transcriptional regulator, regulator of embCAB operon